MYRSLVVWNEILLYIYAFSAFCVHVCTLFFFFVGSLHCVCEMKVARDIYFMSCLLSSNAAQRKTRTVTYRSRTIAIQNKYARKKRPKFLRRGINLMHCRSETKKCTGSIVWCWWWRQCTLSTLHCPFCGPVPHNFLRRHTLSCCGKTFSH